MATEKILNTRLRLKIDTLENWNKSTIGLLKGEIAIATVAASAGTGLTEPVCMIKVGEDGVKTFGQLGWNLYAKASDVLAACKSEATLKAFVNNVIADAGIATNDALQQLAGRVQDVEEDIEILNGDVNTAGSVAKAINDAITALNLSGTYATKTEAQGYADAKDGAIADAKKAGTDATAALNTYKGEMTTALAGKQDVIPVNTYDAYGAAAQALVDAKGYADGKIADANLDQYTTEQEVKNIVDTVIADAVEGDTITGLANLVEYLHEHGGEAAEMGAAIDVLEGKVDIIEKKPAYNITSTQISNWDGEVGAKALAGTKTTATEVKAQIEAYGYATTGYADQAEVDANKYTDEAIGALGTMAKENAVDYVKKSDAPGYADILTKTAAQSAYQPKGEYATATQGGKADTAIQNVTSVAGNGIKATKTGTTVSLDWDTDVVFVFNCGDAGVTA